METLGNYLRNAREKQGITLADLAGRTKIKEQFLAEMEKGNFSALPGPVYVRAFLRLYAREVGLDADDVVARYSGSGSEHKAIIPNPQMEQAATDSAPKKRHYRLRPRAWQLAFVAALALTLLLGRWYAASLQRNNVNPRLDVQEPESLLPDTAPGVNSAEQSQTPEAQAPVESDTDTGDNTGIRGGTEGSPGSASGGASTGLPSAQPGTLPRQTTSSQTPQVVQPQSTGISQGVRVTPTPTNIQPTGLAPAGNSVSENKPSAPSPAKPVNEANSVSKVETSPRATAPSTGAGQPRPEAQDTASDDTTVFYPGRADVEPDTGASIEAQGNLPGAPQKGTPSG